MYYEHSDTGSRLTKFRFDSEYLLRQAIATLLSRIPGIDDVTMLHGAQEYGKDIIFRTAGPLTDVLHCACVIKNHRISGKAGDTRSARSVLDQVEEALEIPYLDGSGSMVTIQRIYVISPEEITQSAIRSIEGRLKSRAGQIVFVGGHSLFALFQSYWPDFLADEFDAVERYLKTLQTQTTNNALPEMANLYNLGQVDKQKSSIYVERRFRRFVPSYHFPSLFNVFPDGLALHEKCSRAGIERTMSRIQDLRRKVAHLASWGYTASMPSMDEIDGALGDFEEAVYRSWVANARKEQFASEARTTRSIPGYVHAAPDSDGLLKAKSESVAELLRDWLFPARVLCRITQQASRCKIPSPQLLRSSLWEAASYFDDCLCAAPLKFTSATEPGSEVNVSEKEIRVLGENLLIVGAAGYGKTSFCRRNCLIDVRLFRERRSKVFPIYIPLHTLAGAECRSFDEAFLGGLGKSALLDADLLRDANRIRLYLDGLDEIPSEEQRKRIVDLARYHCPDEPRTQIVLTSRDYLFSEWLRGFRRINLDSLTEREFAELKTKWLGKDSSLLEAFERQISSLPAFSQVLRVPLLAILVMLVFRQKRSLPESRAGLYGTFVDLLSGGWDLAKNVLRVSRFGRSVKLMVLGDLAATAHIMRQRDFSVSTIATSIGRIVARADEALCEGFCEELLVDGVIARAGVRYYFSHLSFQEFLAAKHIAGDPSGKGASSAVAKFLAGDDWWRELLRFYVSLSNNPEYVTRWIVGQVEKRMASGERSAVLLEAVQEFFPLFDVIGYVKQIGKPRSISALRSLTVAEPA